MRYGLLGSTGATPVEDSRWSTYIVALFDVGSACEEKLAYRRGSGANVLREDVMCNGCFAMLSWGWLDRHRTSLQEGECASVLDRVVVLAYGWLVASDAVVQCRQNANASKQTTTVFGADSHYCCSVEDMIVRIYMSAGNTKFPRLRISQVNNLLISTEGLLRRHQLTMLSYRR